MGVWWTCGCGAGVGEMDMECRSPVGESLGEAGHVVHGIGRFSQAE